MYQNLVLAGLGSIVGFSLGLTGSGGSILTVPFLVYGLKMPTDQAVPLSLVIVSSIATVGAIRQSFKANVLWPTAIIFSLFGSISSSIVIYLTKNTNDNLRLSLFAVLMLLFSWQMYQGAYLKLNTSLPKWLLVSFCGIFSGALTGFFGVGGGFILVPILVFVFNMPFNKAIGTSLAIICLISLSSIATFINAGFLIDKNVFALFFLGGSFGLLLGTTAINKIPESLAKKIFALLVACLACYMVFDNLVLKT